MAIFVFAAVETSTDCCFPYSIWVMQVTFVTNVGFMFVAVPAGSVYVQMQASVHTKPNLQIFKSRELF
jgi:hypothetical protein